MRWPAVAGRTAKNVENNPMQSSRRQAHRRRQGDRSLLAEIGLLDRVLG